LSNTNLYNRGWTHENFKDTKGVIRSRQSKKARQYNGLGKGDQCTNNDPQSITQKTKDQRRKLICSGRLSSSYSTTVNRRVTCLKYPVKRHINFVWFSRHIFVCPNPGPGFSTPYVVVLFVLSDLRWDVIVLFCWYRRIVGHHCLNFLFMILYSFFKFYALIGFLPWA
jgi:hypothetical protein